MYGINDLKQTIDITDQEVECPVKNCTTKVSRARRGQSLRQPSFLCPVHKIFISPSTFEYEDEWENLLWRTPEDRQLMTAVKRLKRESRLARDNSEDALTWNVFRHLERTGRVGDFLYDVVKASVKMPVVSYWSCSTATSSACAALKDARQEFGEPPERSSEPDVIVESEGQMIWIEVKLSSTNNTTPSDPSDTKGYLTGGDAWFKKAFTADYNMVAVTNQRYELMRLWLLGSWIALREGAEFYLINLVSERRRENIFASQIAALPGTHFVCATWEQSYSWLAKQRNNGAGAELLRYMREKSAGYSDGRLARAFPMLPLDA